MPKGSPDTTDTAGNVFGQELLRFRHSTGLSQTKFGQRAGCSRQLVGDVENGAARPTLKFARKIDRAFNTNARFEGLLVSDSELQILLRRYVTIEQQQAVALQQWQTTVVPALLQTKTYARRTLEVSIPALPPAKINQQVKSRLARQEALSRPNPLEGYFVLSEGALTQLVGGAALMRQQWEHLLRCAHLPNVTLQVLPRTAGAHASMQGSYTILETSPPGWAIYVETMAGGEVLTQRKLVTDTRQRFAALMANALSPDESMRYIQRLISEEEP